jgi:hypothetical protein
MKKSILGYIVLFLVISTSLISARTEEVSKSVEMDNAEEIVLSGDLGAGEFNVTTKNISEALTCDITYNPRRVDNDVDSYVKRDKCYITLESDYKRKFSTDTDDNIWNINLSNKYPISFNLDMGACEANMDLGGLRLKEFDLDFGAASGLIDFSKPNPERLRSINIDAGACDLEIISIGNANFDLFEFDGGVGSFELDFRGEYKNEAEIVIEIGLGSLELVLPKNIPVRIENVDDNWLSSVNIHSNSLDEIDDDIYESDDFDDAYKPLAEDYKNRL